jgi:hypothetical protein
MMMCACVRRPLSNVREDYPEVARLRADLIEQCRQDFADKVPPQDE